MNPEIELPKYGLELSSGGRLDNLHAGSLRAFTAFGFLELNGVTFLKLAAIHLVDVDEQIFAAVIGLDETETFLVEEPSYFSCWHNLFLLTRLTGDDRRVPEFEGMASEISENNLRRGPKWIWIAFRVACANISVSMKHIISLCIYSLLVTEAQAADGKHLFILSGQSNMQGHRPQEAFTPAVEKALGKENVIVVQDALGGQPIQRWYKKWTSPQGVKPAKTGDLYDRLMGKVRPAVKGHKLKTVTFIWMQGERDAKMKWGPVYSASLVGLHAQLSADLKRKDVNLVIGRLSDFDLKNKRYPHWTMVREAQVKLAESKPHFAWVNTDDLNDGKNRRGKEIKDDLHYSAEGYKTLGKRFAESALNLIAK